MVIASGVATAPITSGTFADPSREGRAEILGKPGIEVVVTNDCTLNAALPPGTQVRLTPLAGEWLLVAASC